MNHKEELIKRLRAEAEQIEVPNSLQPENMIKNIKHHEAHQIKTLRNRRRNIQKMTTAAACFFFVFLGGLGIFLWTDQGNPVSEKETPVEQFEVAGEAEPLEEEEQSVEYPKIGYEDIYLAMSETWERESAYLRNEMPAAEAGVIVDFEEEKSAVEESAVAADKSFHETNVQTIGVDEGDIVKNDGRYLYQKIQVSADQGTKWAIQIIDTKEKLKEVSQIKDMEGLVEFYIWEDLLITIEEKYLDAGSNGIAICGKFAYFENCYHEIKIFDIKDRYQPKEIRNFQLQGSYASSRISEGYFYGFSKYYANPGNGKNDYNAYIPVLDGSRIAADRIFLPKELDVTSYLVLAAIDLRNPTQFTDTTAIVSGAQNFYVSSENIFVADGKYEEQKEGWSGSQTKILRFSYQDGKFTLRAMGEVKGQLEGSFSMDEYEDHLRIVTTVFEHNNEKITDDRTGTLLGYRSKEERQTNALYVLDHRLDVVGKIEGLAENEQIYSARFMGDVGYFVTFRQTDPLFTVDLKNPENPRILSELKVSGFSEYLHIYGEDRLLGIGMEADTETGIQQGMKLSMFDVSDRENVTEITKTNLSQYNHSEALYNHHGVLINVGKNIFGFAAEGSSKGNYWYDYLVYTYENDEFVQKFKINAKNKDGNCYTVRGTYIGDTFYLLRGDGSVDSYDLNDGKHLDGLEP